MRSEKEMFYLILEVAKNDERIRAVYMNGSRTNPNVPKDIFQDFDIVYVVTETASFIKDEQWINVFGDLMNTGRCMKKLILTAIMIICGSLFL